MTKAIFIDSAKRELREVEYRTDTDDLQKLIDGWIERAFEWDSGDNCFVDEEGLFKPQKAFFRLGPRGSYPFAGNGVVVGKERHDEEGEYLGTDDPTISVEMLRPLVTFLTREQAEAWSKANASEPAVEFFSIGPDGQLERKVLARMGSIFSDMPKPPGEEKD